MQRAAQHWTYRGQDMNSGDFAAFANLYESFRIDAVDVTITPIFTPSYIGVGSNANPGPEDPRVLPNAMFIYCWNDKDGKGLLDSTTEQDAENLGIKRRPLFPGKSIHYRFYPNTVRQLWTDSIISPTVLTPNARSTWLSTDAAGQACPYFGMRSVINTFYNTRNAVLELEKPDVLYKFKYLVSFKNRKATTDSNIAEIPDTTTELVPITAGP